MGVEWIEQQERLAGRRYAGGCPPGGRWASPASEGTPQGRRGCDSASGCLPGGCSSALCEADRQGRPGWSAEAEVCDAWQCLSALLWDVLRDGGRKRDAGVKPHWSVDEHEPSMHRHIRSWDSTPYGYDPDPDSGAHPLVHAAARALMIAAQELGIARRP